MKYKFFPVPIVLLGLVLMGQPLLPAQESGKKKPSGTNEYTYSVAVNAAYNRTNVELKDGSIESTLEYSYMALQVDVDILPFLTVGVVAGYNSNEFKDPVVLFNPPVTLPADGVRFSSMMLGLRAKSEMFSWKEFSLAAHGRLLYFKRFEKQLTIDHPIATGSGLLKNVFHQVGLDLLVQYDGYSGLTLFAGPQLNLVSGKLSAVKTVGFIDSNDELTYDQAKAFGLAAGAYYELGSNFDISAKLSLISTTSLSVMLIYVF
ncbi:MAG: hypothetical protein GY940_07490 [bacterium]|nr:hypothetical protein [bacterium]